MVLGVPIPTGVMHRNSKVLIGLDITLDYCFLIIWTLHGPPLLVDKANFGLVLYN